MLMKHCRFDTDTTRIPPDTDDFVDFRRSAIESVKDVAFILGTMEVVGSVSANNPTHPPPQMVQEIAAVGARGGTWDELEAGLFIIRAAANSIVQTEHRITPELIGLIRQVPNQSNPILLLTTLELIGELNEWLADKKTELGEYHRVLMVL